MVMLRTMLRPRSATRRPLKAAASSTCCTRCTWLEKLATITRRGERAMTSSSTGPMERSSGVKPGTSALVESTMNRSTPSSPRRANSRRSVRRPSSGSWSILKSPVASTVPARVLIATASASGIEWLTAMNSRSNGPIRSCWPSVTVRRVRLDAVLLELRLDEREGQRRADQGDVGAQAQEVGHRADVVLVAVGEHDPDDVLEALAEEPEVGQDQVDARLVLLGEEHAAVDDEDLAVDLEARHVAADLAEAADGDDAERPGFERCGIDDDVGHGPSLRCGVQFMRPFRRMPRPSFSVWCPRPSAARRRRRRCGRDGSGGSRRRGCPARGRSRPR